MHQPLLLALADFRVNQGQQTCHSLKSVTCIQTNGDNMLVGEVCCACEVACLACFAFSLK